MNPYRDSFFNAFDELFSKYGTLSRSEFLDDEDGSVVMWVQPTKPQTIRGFKISWALAMNNLGLVAFSFVDGKQDEMAHFELDDNGQYVKYLHSRDLTDDSHPSLAEHVAQIFNRNFKLKFDSKDLN
jgi:hypothetical protein